jgi:hypothetical protein
MRQRTVTLVSILPRLEREHARLRRLFEEALAANLDATVLINLAQASDSIGTAIHNTERRLRQERDRRDQRYDALYQQAERR